MRKRAHVSMEDLVELDLEMDNQPRLVPMPAELAQALEKNALAKAAYETLSPSRQKEILAYLNWIKQPETLKRNIDKLIAKLAGKP